eukprot:6047988-Amphidinium_carterae.1
MRALPHKPGSDVQSERMASWVVVCAKRCELSNIGYEPSAKLSQGERAAVWILHPIRASYGSLSHNVITGAHDMLQGVLIASTYHWKSTAYSNNALSSKANESNKMEP